jgi:hypothetical protein
MELTQLILTIFITALFCNGWNIITDKGKLLYFIRKPFDNAMDNIDQTESKIQLLSQFKNNKYHLDYLKKRLLFNKALYYIGKPFVLCITCYSSIWGFSVFVALNGLHIDTIPHLIINSVSAAYLNTLIYKHYVKLD